MELGDLSITWLGHAAIKLELADGTVSYIDPWLGGNPLCPDDETAPDRVDSIYVTHGHFDHFGATLDLMRAHQPHIFAIHEIAVYLESQGGENIVGSNKGGTVEGPGGIKATMVDAVHSSGISTDDGIIPGGEAAGWVLEMPNGRTIYHAGDTAVFGDMRLIGQMWDIDVAILPIGGHFTMGPEQAGRAAEMLQTATVLPIHYGTFPILAGRPAGLHSALAGATIEVLDPEIGVPFSGQPDG